MLATECGKMWLAKWHKTTPSLRADDRFSGKATFSRDSIVCKKIIQFVQTVLKYRSQSWNSIRVKRGKRLDKKLDKK